MAQWVEMLATKSDSWVQPQDPHGKRPESCRLSPDLHTRRNNCELLGLEEEEKETCRTIVTRVHGDLS